MRFTMILDERTGDALRLMAGHESRSMRDQAEFLVRRALLARGYLRADARPCDRAALAAIERVVEAHDVNL